MNVLSLDLTLNTFNYLSRLRESSPNAYQNIHCPLFPNPNTPPTHKPVRLVETLISFEDGSLFSMMFDPDPHFVRTLSCVISLVMQLQTGKEINHKHATSTLIEWNLLW